MALAAVRPRPYLRAAVAGRVALAALVAASLGPSFPFEPEAVSSHRDAPTRAADPRVDGADLYAFVSPDDPDRVTFISTWGPFQEPASGPNFYAFAPGVRYDIRIDNNHDAVADLTYRWVFRNRYRTRDTFLYATGSVSSPSDVDLNFFQTYDLIRLGPGGATRLVEDAIAAPSDVGRASMPDYGAVRDLAAYPVAGGGRVFAGPADDPHFSDLRLYDRLYGPDFSESGVDTLRGFNVGALVLQLPKRAVARAGDVGGNPMIGVWSTASRKTFVPQRRGGDKVFVKRSTQVARMGMPFVNEVVVPLRDKDRFASSKPVADAQFLAYFDDPELARLMNEIHGVAVPDTDPVTPGTQRSDLVSVFLTGLAGLNQPQGGRPSEQLRLNLTISPCDPGTCPSYSRLGVIGDDSAGFPNGRRLADDVVDVVLQVMEGELAGAENDLGDGVDGNDVAFSSSFPYVALPHRGSDDDPHGP